jgi:hypothetical protein
MLPPPRRFLPANCSVGFADLYVRLGVPTDELFQNPSLLEVIAQPIPEIKYGDALDVMVNTAEITIARVSA